jgi:hypothetical protein
MKSFFRGWRRKLGVVTLVMALVLMGGWVRSRMIGERLAFRTHQEQFVFLGSNSGILSYCTLTGRIGSPITIYQNWPAEPQIQQNVVMRQDGHWGVIHFRKTTSTTSPRIVFDSLEIPYWSVTIPLTLLSAYLILWKPRKQPSPI